MAKAFLLRFGSEEDFKSIKLQLREPGFAIDSEKLFIGGTSRNLHIPNEEYVSKMINEHIDKRGILSGTSTDLAVSQPLLSFAYDTTLKRIVFKGGDGQRHIIVENKDIPRRTGVSIKIAAENIETEDNNSVIIQGYNSPIEMIFKNGILCTVHPDDPNRYEVDRENNLLKIYNCAENDIITYF